MRTKDKKVYYGRSVPTKSTGSTPKTFFIIHGNSSSKYQQMFRPFEGSRIKVTIEKVSYEEWRKEVLHDPR